jgi:streptomycin 6-kinase
VDIAIPPRLACAAHEDGIPARHTWLATLPARVEALAVRWSLELGDPYLPGGQAAWVAPARDVAGHDLVLKVGWRHTEAEHEADGLRVWAGGGAVFCHAAEATGDSSALLLERCVPGTHLGSMVSEPEQDPVVARLLRRLWEHEPPEGHPFRTLASMCGLWAAEFERRVGENPAALDPGLANAAVELLRTLPRTADQAALLCTDLHAENILAAEREPWLVIDPKPFVGDPAFDVVQHMLNCDRRLASDPVALAARMARLADLDPLRVRLWLFARCAQESPGDPSMREPARRLAP